MSGFDDREKGFEAKYGREEELRFKVAARRNKLLGLWAAELMGLEGDNAEAYAKEVVVADLEEPGDEDVIRKVLGDFETRGVAADEHKIRARLDAAMAEAREQIESGS